MKFIHILATGMLALAMFVFVIAAMAADSLSNAPLQVMFIALGYMLFYFCGWKRVLKMTVSPIKELRGLIYRGVQSITIDYRRIPKCWHIVMEEELMDAGYKKVRTTGPVLVWNYCE